MALETLALTPMTELEEKVSRGAQRLDIYRPGWSREVDVAMIEIGCELHSITGQLFGPEIIEQFIGVGISPNRDNPEATIDEFVGLGFGVRSMEIVAVPDSLKALMSQVATDVANLAGLDAGEIREVPDVLPVPRDTDLVTQEAATLTYLWEKAIAERA